MTFCTPVALAATSLAMAFGLSACGSSDEPTGNAGDGIIRIAALGDSITSGSPGYDPDAGAAAAAGFGTDPQSSYEYWAEQANPGIELVNCGIFGQRTDEIASRLTGCATGADAIVIQGGINDIAQGLPAEAAAENLRGMVRSAKELGLAVAIVDVLPWNRGYPAADPQILDLNERIAAIARDESVELLPFHDTLEDPARPGRMRDDWTADGDHPSVEGYRRLGEVAFAVPGAG